jgi:hypothetical protein
MCVIPSASNPFYNPPHSVQKATMTADQMFQSFTETQATQGKHAALDAIDMAMSTAKAQDASDDTELCLGVLKFILPLLAAHSPKLRIQTLNTLRPIIDAGSETASDSRSTHWTGDSFLRLFAGVCHDMQDLAVKTRARRVLPDTFEIHILARIPQRLLMALSRVMAEALPAIGNSGQDPEATRSLGARRFPERRVVVFDSETRRTAVLRV